MKHKYKFSIIIPVYNAEKYLKETIDSVIKQTIGFEENIQLILINDGSTDNSEQICITYKRKYPDNIVYYKKENEGVSKTRNFGMRYIKGKYVNFFDSDDIWDKTAFEKAYNILEIHNEIDMVSFRVKLFDAKNEFHVLDYRFDKGNRIVDINEDPYCIQTFIGTAIFRYEAIKNIRFDTNLKYAEDTKFANELFFQKQKYGLIADAIYYYRKRKDQSSATQMGGKNDFYYDALKGTYLYLIKKSIEEFGQVKKYFQALAMYELQWRIKKEISKDLEKSKKAEYIETFEEILCYIDDDIILNQKSIGYEYKALALRIKYQNNLLDKLEAKTDGIYVKGNLLVSYQDITNLIETSKIEKDNLLLDGELFLLDKEIELYCSINNGEKRIKMEFYATKKIKNVFYDKYNTQIRNVYRTLIPLQSVKNIQFEIKIADEYWPIKNKFINFSRINNFKAGYYYANKYLITKKGNNIIVQYKPNPFKVLWREIFFLAYIVLKRKRFKVALQRVLYWITKPFIAKNIWLFSDREFMARDSGELMFRYTNKQENIDGRSTYFAIDKHYEDYQRMKQYGKVISYHTLKYKLLFLNSKYVISSHADAYITNPFGKARKFYIDLFQFDYIYLTHGILLHNSTSWLNRLNTNICLNVVTSPLEYNSILKGNYYFEPNELIKSGLPRHDNLVQKDVKEENKILIMASWRSKLAGKIIKGTQRREYNPKFKKSQYCQFYNKLFKDEKLQEVLKKYNYKMKFCVHPSFRAQFEDFEGNDLVEIAIDVDSQYETKSSKMLITDYSSAACDFAYLRKPVIYANFDLNHIFDIHYYRKGYFDYDINGFGPNCKTYETTLNEIIKCIENNCQIEEKYKKRCDEFFYHHDGENCKRVYEAILEHDKKRK